MYKAVIAGGRRSGRTIAERGAENFLYRAKLKAADWFRRECAGKLTREQVRQRLADLPEKERDLVRAELNRLNTEWKSKQK
jgi:hypothetical protein